MKQLIAFIRKEFCHVFRDKRTLLILFGLPVVQIMLFGFALNSEVKNIGITVLDHAKDADSEQIISKIDNSSYFILRESTDDMATVEERFLNGTAKCALVFPHGFGADLQKTGIAHVQIIADASDPNTAQIVRNYITQILASYTQDINPTVDVKYQVMPEMRNLYNEEQNGSLNFIPGVISLIFMIVSTALTSVSVVREKEMGTMEILLVSPFKPIMVLVSKAVPYLVLSFLNLVIILMLSVFVLGVPIRGNLLLLLLVSLLFIITCLSLGLLISNITQTQQAAMLVSMMGMMLPTIILTGFLFPLENMPTFFQYIAHIMPSRYYFLVVKDVMLKGLGFSYVWKEILVLVLMTVALLGIALKRFKIRLS